MPRRQIDLVINVDKKDIIPRFKIKQFDSVLLKITLVKDNKPYDARNKNIKLYIACNNELYEQKDSIVVNNDCISISLDENILKHECLAYAELEISDRDGNMTSSTFLFNIIEKIAEGKNIGNLEGFVEKYEKLISDFKIKSGYVLTKLQTDYDTTKNDVIKTSNDKILELEDRFNTLTSKQQQDSEVIDARAGAVSLKARLDNFDSQLEHNMNGITLLELKTDFVYPEFYGAVGDGLANDTEAFNKMLATNKPIRFIKSATYRIGNIVFPAKCDMRSDYDVILNLYQSNSKNPILLGFKSNSYFENINFVSTEEDLEWNRGNITGVENVTFNRCKFEGFRHNSSTPNSWGIYVENSKDITIRKCGFENNSQSDITILDGCDNIILDSNYGSNFVVNIEPNGVSGKYVSNVKISNSNISKLYSLENSYTFESVKNANIECCTIENLIYRGGNLFFKSSIVKNIVDQDKLYGGYVELDTMSLSHNLCESKIYDIGNSASDGRSWYGSYSNTSNLLTRVITKAGKGLLLNDGAKQNYSSVETKVSINEGLYLIKINSQSFYSDDSVYIANHGKISFYNDTDSLLIEKNIVFNQGLQGETTIPKESHIFVNAPSNTSYCVIRLRNSSTNSTSRLLVFNFEFRKVYLGKVNKIYEDNSKIFVSGIPKSINQAGTNHIFLKGDRVYIKEPVAGGYEGYVCIESGNPGTWKGFGVIES